MMPGLDGLELTRRLRSDPCTRHIPVVMLTARADVEDRVAGLEMGVNAYLAKPFSAKELITTVRSQLENQQAAADVLLTQSMDSLETLAAGLAHQIRNPLNYVKNALVTIQRDSKRLVETAVSPTLVDGKSVDVLTARMQKMFDTAETGVRRIAATVDLMIRYSREGYTRMTQPYDVFAGLRDVVRMVLPTSAHRVQVATEIEGDGLIDCVPEEFNQVLTNLVENAIEAVAVDGRVLIRGFTEGSWVVLCIRDNGMGIAPEDQPKIFNAFYTTKDVGRGMGMGLTIVHRVVTALGGTIAVTSQLGEGSEFVVRVPRAFVASRTTRSVAQSGVETAP